MKTKSQLLFLIPLLFFPGSTFAEELRLKVLECAMIGDGPQRFGCYEALGQELLALEQEQGEKVPTPVAPKPLKSKQNKNVSKKKSTRTQAADAADANEMPDELGGKQFKKTKETSSKGPKILAKGRVTSCRKAIDGKWLYIYENGQVWKQVDSRHRSYRSCDFLTTIKKDGIGFKMQVEGEKRTVRVKRYR